MSKSRLRKKGRDSKPDRHVRLYHTMMRTEAWRSLTAVARVVYVEMSIRYNGSNNGRIVYAVRDATRSLKIGVATAAAALRMLQERGFIVVMVKGAFSRKVRHATEWRLTEFPNDAGPELATRDYEMWTAKIQNTVPVAEPMVSSAEPIGTPGRTMAV